MIIQRKRLAAITLRVLPLGALALAGCGSGSSSTGVSGPTGRYTASFQEFTVPVAADDPTTSPPGSWPDDLTVDSVGRVWFAEHEASQIGCLEPGPTLAQSRYTGFAVPTRASEMDSIAVDSQRNLVWVTENAGNKVARLDLNQSPAAVTEINVATTANPNPVPGDIIPGNNGSVWFTEGYETGVNVLGKIATLDSSGAGFMEITDPSPQGGADDIRFDSNGALWVDEIGANKVARYSNGQFTEFALPRANVTPTNLVPVNGMVYVTEQGGNAIAVLNPTAPVGQQWQELPIPTDNSGPSGIRADASGNVWFTEFNSSKIGLIPAGTSTVVDFAIPTANSGPEDITVGPDGKVYFTEQYGNKIGQISVTGI